jgi:hypothetical protein
MLLGQGIERAQRDALAVVSARKTVPQLVRRDRT